MKRTLVAVLAAAALCLVVAAPVAAGSGGVRPFETWTSGTDSMGDASPCPAGALLRYVSVGSGSMQHLGLTGLMVSHCVWVDSPTTGHFGAGTMTFTAANGDTLVLAQQGTYQFDAFPPTTSTVEMTWVVVGGTGRFADAEGSGSGAGSSDMVAGTSRMHLSGTISY